MDKVWILASVVLTAFLITSLVSAIQVTQEVRAEVVSGLIDIHSPQTDMYQENMIPLNISVQTGSLKVKDIKIFENKDLKPLCSRCENFFGEMFFSEGAHSLRIIAEFEDNSQVEETIYFSVDSKSDIYLMDSGILRKATAKDIVNYLFHYNFTLVYETNNLPDDSCSIRAKGGNSTVNGKNVGSKNKINFYTIFGIKQGTAGISSQGTKDRLSLRLDFNETLENSPYFIKIKFADKNKKEVLVELNKSSQTIDVIGNNFSIKNMDIYFSEGCGVTTGNFYFLEKNSRKSNNIESVRKVLTENPIFIEKYEGLRYLFNKYWRIQQILGIG